MRARRLIATAAAVAASLTTVAAVAPPTGAQGGGAAASEIGITGDTIRITVIADVDNQGPTGPVGGLRERGPGVREVHQQQGRWWRARGPQGPGRLHRLQAEPRRGPDHAPQGVRGGLRHRRDDGAVPQQHPADGRVRRQGRRRHRPARRADPPDRGTAHQCNPISFPIIAGAARLRHQGPAPADLHEPGPARSRSSTERRGPTTCTAITVLQQRHPGRRRGRARAR